MTNNRGLIATAAVAVAVIVGCAIAGAMMFFGNRDSQIDDRAQEVDADPNITAIQTATTLFSFDPAVDDSPESGLDAIRGDLTGTLAELADNPPTGDEAARTRPKEWDAWQRGGDRVQAFADVSEHSPQVPARATHATVRLNVQQQVMHPDGDTTPWRQMNISVDLEKQDNRWKADSYTLNDTK